MPPTTREQAEEQDRKEVEEMDKAINALIANGTVQYWTVLARMLTAKYLRRLAIASEHLESRGSSTWLQ